MEGKIMCKNSENSILRAMCKCYLEHNASKLFIVGIKRFRNINACIIDGKTLINICLEENIIEYDTRKNSVRFIYQPNKHKGFERIMHESIRTFPVCAWSDFQAEQKELFQGQRYNFGDTFERLVTEMYDKVWHKDNAPWYVRGDININGKEMQIKDASHRATLFALKHLTKNGWM